MISSTDARRVTLALGFVLVLDLLSSLFSLFLQHVLLVRGSPPCCSAAIVLCLTTGLGCSSPSSALSADSGPSGGWLVQLVVVGLVTREFYPLVDLGLCNDSSN